MVATLYRSLVSAIVIMMVLTSCQTPPPTQTATINTKGSEVGWWTTQLDDGTPLDPDSTAPDHLVITIKADVFFDPGSSVLKLSETDALNDVAALIISNNQPVALRGHTDAIGSNASNISLGQDRAHSLRVYLTQNLNVPEGLIVAVESQGESCPAATNATPEGRSSNRRVEIYQPEHPPPC